MQIISDMEKNRYHNLCVYN